MRGASKFVFALFLFVSLWALAMAITSAFLVTDLQKAEADRKMNLMVFNVFNYVTCGVTGLVSGSIMASWAFGRLDNAGF